MLSLDRVSKTYRTQAALHEVSFEVGAGEIVGLVGRSGSGKSTIANCILGLQQPDAGALRWNGRCLAGRQARRLARREIQMVFQDPRASLDPRWTVRRILGEPLDNWPGADGGRRSDRLAELLDAVALTPDLLGRYPHELSTGQCQRICIARAMAPNPRLLVLDEPLSALDVSVQARILDILDDLHRRTRISYLLITHDFAVVRDICQRVVVLESGLVVQSGGVEDVLDSPADPRTASLLRDVLPLPILAVGRNANLPAKDRTK